MELFHENGHLTQEGFQALINGKLDEMGRLEAAEHLSFCDECLLRYTALLENEDLAAPSEPLAAGVWQRIRRRTMRVFTSRYATAAAAAVFALIIWGTGVFQNMGGMHQARPSAPPEPKAYAGTVTSRMNEFVSETSQQIGTAISDFFAQFQKGAQQ